MTQSPQQIVPCDTPVDEEPCPSPSPCEGPKELLILAAKTADLLTRKVEVLIEFLKNSDAATLRDISYTLATVTPHEDVYRVGCLASNKKEAIDQLSLFATRTENTELPSSVLVGVPSPNKRKLVLLFSGQGPQWFGMGRGLFETNRIFRESMIELNAIHKKLDPEVDFVKAMFSSEEDARINETRFLQPRFVAEQMSLAEVVKAAELPIDMIVGHSLGETGACHVCGSLTKEEAMLVMHERCRAQYELNGKGTMAVIKLPRGEVLEAIKKYSHIGLAGENSTLYHNVAGPCEEVWQLVEELSSTGVFAKGLGIDEAMHSYQVEWKRDQLLSCLAGLVPRPPSIPIVSTFTPLDRRPIVYNAEYWYSSLKAPVEFRDALLEVFARLDETHSDQQVCVEPVFVELDAFPILRLFVDELGGELGRPYRFVETLQKDKFSDRDEMLRAFGELFVLGFNPNFGSSLFVSGTREEGREGKRWFTSGRREENRREFWC
ncbi:putative Phthioceranic/hydroxyphthioceranic acid synthase [Blattamonas nauphoetae]|uniref:Phthioceranic/hydroxyphthioceranic acid synthase n=1 Tax=Blattamonas nauphoetae TaxID=2049346 RepID=A0ABQ9Y2S3_9EUKA|nr:putative Phthioceranic/hydroxyphthioceranic acid synthase [Blattamonas nauphoetae]